MKDHPILFSGSMILALLAGRKTQTRRVLMPQPKYVPDGAGFHQPFPDEVPLGWVAAKNGMAYSPLKVKHAVSDHLWVREPWRSDKAYDDLSPSAMGGEEAIRYIADAALQTWGYPTSHFDAGRLRASMHMPRWASRITLKVTEVRVQRLQEISEEDAQEEGVEPYSGIDPNCTGYLNYRNNSADGYWPSARGSFCTLWDSLNAKPKPRKGPDGKITHYESYPWGGESRTETHRGKPHIITANPWVTATSFEAVRGNIDEVTAGAMK